MEKRTELCLFTTTKQRGTTVSFVITYCSPDLATVRLQARRPLQILFLTSVRDTGECDRNGMMVETGHGQRYMEGIIESTVRETFPGRALHGLYEVAGIITDDLPKDLRDYPPLPNEHGRWLWPLQLSLPNGCPLIECTVNIPSEFRRLPLKAQEERRAAKLAFEQAVFALFRKWEADVIVSDHYMARIEHLITTFGLYGRVLNIHPAVTVAGHTFCFRGPTPTADAIAQAQRGINTQTGATLHLLNLVIDDGPPIAYAVGTPVYATDEPQWLRWRNYQSAKLPLFIAGMRHYYQLVTRRALD